MRKTDLEEEYVSEPIGTAHKIHNRFKYINESTKKFWTALLLLYSYEINKLWRSYLNVKYLYFLFDRQERFDDQLMCRIPDVIVPVFNRLELRYEHVAIAIL